MGNNQQNHSNQASPGLIAQLSSGLTGTIGAGSPAAMSTWPCPIPNSPLIYKKMSAVMKDIGHVGKDQKNTAQGFKFRGVDQFVNTLYPALTKHGVFMVPRATSYTHELRDVTRGNGKAGTDKHVAIMMEYTFYAEDGSNVVVGPVPAEGLDSGDKATNKALSAALKYALIQTFSVPTEDMSEADLETPEIGNSKATVQTVLDSHKEVSEAYNKASHALQATQPPITSSFRKPKSKAAEPATTSDGWDT